MTLKISHPSSLSLFHACCKRKLFGCAVTPTDLYSDWMFIVFSGLIILHLGKYSIQSLYVPKAV